MDTGKGQGMRIAQMAPLAESVPPQKYGGTERVVSWLTEELVRLGHDVTLFATGDSRTSARLVAPCQRGLRLSSCHDPFIYNVLMLELLFAEIDRFDVVHMHHDYMHFPMARRSEAKFVTTLHGRLDLPDLVPIFREFSDMPLVSISDSQRAPLRWANWIGTVHHGMPLDLLKPSAAQGEYLAFLGRISPEKRPDRAIEIARRTGRKLKIAAKVDPVDAEYWRDHIQPMLGRADVEYVGEIGDADKSEFLGRASALLFPIDWPEPFGLVMMESMACGVPVIGFRRGSVPEVIDDGVTGFIVDDLDQAVASVAAAESLDRTRIRMTFERRFSVRRMAQDYLTLYERGAIEEPENLAVG